MSDMRATERLLEVWAVYEMCTYEIMGIAGGKVYADQETAEGAAEQLNAQPDEYGNTEFVVRRLEIER